MKPRCVAILFHALLFLLSVLIYFILKGPEICNDLNSVGTKLDYWVTGYGTASIVITFYRSI